MPAMTLSVRSPLINGEDGESKLGTCGFYSILVNRFEVVRAFHSDEDGRRVIIA